MKQRVLFLLVAAGLIISSYLYWKTFDPSSVVCSIGGGCETVLSSSYAKIAGFPIAGLGVIWYASALILVWLVYFQRIWAELPFRLWALAGLAFSLYLLYLEKYQIHAYCTWCLSSLALVVLITVLSFARKK